MRTKTIQMNAERSLGGIIQEDTASREFKLFKTRLLEALSSASDARPMEKLQIEYINKLITDARSESKYYRARIKARRIGSLADLFRLPILERNLLEENLDEIACPPPRPSRQVHLFTAGASGSPLRIPTFGFNLERRCLLLTTALMAAGSAVSRRAPKKILKISSLNTWPSFQAKLRNGAVFRAIKISANDKNAVASLLDHLIETQPDVLEGSPGSLILLAEYATAKKKGLPAPGILLTTEYQLLPAARKYLETAYSTEAVEMYEIAEAGPIALECPHGNGMHLLHPHIILESLGPGNLTAGHISPGELVLTTSINPVLPLIRYKTGDIGIISDEPCPCGNPFPRLLHVSAHPGTTPGRWDNNINFAEFHRAMAAIPLFRYNIARKDNSVTVHYHARASADKVEPRITSVISKIVSPHEKIVIKREAHPAKPEKSPGFLNEPRSRNIHVALRRTGAYGDDIKNALLDALSDVGQPNCFNATGSRALLLAGCPLNSMGNQDRLRLEGAIEALESIARDSGMELRKVMLHGRDGDSGKNFRGGAFGERTGTVSTWNPDDAPRDKTPESTRLRTAGDFDFVVNLSYCTSGEPDDLYMCGHNLAAFLEPPRATSDADEKTGFTRALDQIKPNLNILLSPVIHNHIKGNQLLLILSMDAAAVDTVTAEILGKKALSIPHLAEAARSGLPGTRLSRLILNGICPEVGRRPCLASPRQPGDDSTCAIRHDPDLCERCGTCSLVCPPSCINFKDGVPRINHSACIKCFNCVEFCPGSALSPLSGPDCVVAGAQLLDRGPWLCILSGRPPVPGENPWPPPFLQPKPHNKRAGKAKYVLGLSINTMQEHAAALVRDGKIVGAVEEERFKRVKHYGWTMPGQGGGPLSSGLLIPIERAFCRKSIDSVLAMENISLDDVDYIAINGIPARYWRTFSGFDPLKPPAILKSGRLVFIPHHLAHAASAYRVSALKKASVFTVDGSGDRETAAFFSGEGVELRLLFDVMTMADSSIGGVYETVTRILGFGRHGQGSTMALAPLGRPAFDLSENFSLVNSRQHNIHEWGVHYDFGRLHRMRGGPLLDEHRDFASSAQDALEKIVLALIKQGLKNRRPRRLCMAGGVALNCSMNSHIKNELGLDDLFIQPGAHDAGTAIGAALEAYHFLTGNSPSERLDSACLGPQFDNERIEETLNRLGVRASRECDIESRCAELLAAGNIVCRFQDRMEFGPRALGNRSILANPADPRVKARLNLIKSREPWRPFGPSILKGKESACFENSFHSPFMLFTFKVKKSVRDRIPAVVHSDGTTRPQSVAPETSPRYYKLIEHFEKLTGIPMVLNTSFNTGDEPIVCTPEDALKSFARLGADYLSVGDFLVSRASLLADGCALRIAAEASAASPAPAGIFRGKRLALRLTVLCNNNCIHCTIRDIRHLPERTTTEALAELSAGIEAGCSELVFMRGEATLRDDFVYLAGRARDMGYNLIQAQTNGRMFSYPGYVERLTGAGVNSLEVSIYGHTAALHDAVSGAPGAFAQTVKGLENIISSGNNPLVTVPVIKQNYKSLSGIVKLLDRLGVRRVQFNFSRPVKDRNGVRDFTVAPLAEAAPLINSAMRAALALNMFPDTEAVPLCLLDPQFRHGAETSENWENHMISDLHVRHVSAVPQMKQNRSSASQCHGCTHEKTCPGTWRSYLERFGSSELKRI
ncbi:MAG: carbamoyltransferase C-terminal domain-containing protein [bacterium]